MRFRAFLSYGQDPRLSTLTESQSLMAVDIETSDVALSLDLFEDRYGPGSHARLLAQLRQPCVTFAEIAGQFGVTRECVRQWHRRLLPGAPSGHARQRLCRLRQRREVLLSDPLFGRFYQRVRPALHGRQLVLLPARDGFRKRCVRIEQATVLLKKAGRATPPPAERTHAAYVLTNSAAHVDFIYFELNPEEFLLLPRETLSGRATTFLDSERSRYHRFKNSFAALTGPQSEVAQAQAS